MTPTSTLDTIFGAVDLDGIEGKVATVGVVIVGLALAFKGLRYAKRLISAA